MKVSPKCKVAMDDSHCVPICKRTVVKNTHLDRQIDRQPAYDCAVWFLFTPISSAQSHASDELLSQFPEGTLLFQENEDANQVQVTYERKILTHLRSQVSKPQPLQQSALHSLHLVNNWHIFGFLVAFAIPLLQTQYQPEKTKCSTCPNQ